MESCLTPHFNSQLPSLFIYSYFSCCMLVFQHGQVVNLFHWWKQSWTAYPSVTLLPFQRAALFPSGKESRKEQSTECKTSHILLQCQCCCSGDPIPPRQMMLQSQTGSMPCCRGSSQCCGPQGSSMKMIIIHTSPKGCLNSAEGHFSLCGPELRGHNANLSHLATSFLPFPFTFLHTLLLPSRCKALTHVFCLWFFCTGIMGSPPEISKPL